MSFEFGYTCPEIDRCLAEAKDTLADHFRDEILECSPLLPEATVEERSRQCAAACYEYLEPIFEQTRKTNEDMRAEAEAQIDDLKDQIEELESRFEE